MKLNEMISREKTTTKVVIVGAGWAGISAAVAASQAGAEVIVLERTDMLLGTGLAGGVVITNGRWTAAKEAIAMGLKDIFDAINQAATHRNINFPGHEHVTLYSGIKIEPMIKKMMEDKGVQIQFQCRVKDVEMDGNKITAVVTDGGDRMTGDIFIDTTGSTGPYVNCNKYGNGCAMCVLRCHSFGGRISLAAKAGAREYTTKRPDGQIGIMSGSCKIFKDSLSKEICNKLNEAGVAIIPISKCLSQSPKNFGKQGLLSPTMELADSIILMDTDHAKLTMPYYPLKLLRQIPGMENARFEDPYAGGIGNSMRCMAMAPRDNTMLVEGVENLFCAGEKAGPLVGHVEAIVTGSLAGTNAVRKALGMKLVIIPESLSIGDAIAYVREQVKTPEGLSKVYTFATSVYFDRMKEKGLYLKDIDDINLRVEQAGMRNIFAIRLCPQGH